MDITKISDINFGVDNKCFYIDNKIYASHLELRIEGNPFRVTYVADSDSFFVMETWEPIKVTEHQHNVMLKHIVKHNPDFDIYIPEGEKIYKSDMDKSKYTEMMMSNVMKHSVIEILNVALENIGSDNSIMSNNPDAYLPLKPLFLECLRKGIDKFVNMITDLNWKTDKAINEIEIESPEGKKLLMYLSYRNSMDIVENNNPGRKNMEHVIQKLSDEIREQKP